MSISPELAHIAPAAATQTLAEPANGHVAEVAIFPTPVSPEPEPEVKAKRSRPSWLASASVGMVALVATGALGYTLYTTSRQRDATQAHLNATETTLAAARSDAATRKVTADYVALYIADSGKVHSDYQNEVTCDTYSQCRTVAQQLLSDLQAFQADSPVECVAFSPDGYLGLSGDSANVRVWNLEYPSRSYAYAVQNRVAAVAFSPGNDRLLYATGQPNSKANLAGIRIQSS